MMLTSSEMKLLKRAINTLDELSALVSERVELRTEAYDNHTEKWQESERGEEYQSETDKLSEFADEIDNSLDYFVTMYERVVCDSIEVVNHVR